MLIRGEGEVCICGECVELARDIVGARRLGIFPEDGPGALRQPVVKSNQLTEDGTAMRPQNRNSAEFNGY